MKHVLITEGEYDDYAFSALLAREEDFDVSLLAQEWALFKVNHRQDAESRQEVYDRMALPFSTSDLTSAHAFELMSFLMVHGGFEKNPVKAFIKILRERGFTVIPFQELNLSH